MGHFLRWVFLVLALFLPCLIGCGPASTSQEAAESEIREAEEAEANMAPDPAEVDEVEQEDAEG